VRNFNPQTKQFNERPITRVQGDIDGAPDFSAGVLKDLPGSSVPANGLHDSQNRVVYPNKLIDRPGTQRWSNTALPALATGYTWTKTGVIVTKTVGTDFTSADVNNFLVHDDGAHERISAYIDANNVIVESSTVRAASTAGWIRGPNRDMYFHQRKKIIARQLGNRIYISHNIRITQWDRCYPMGTNAALSNSLSIIDELENYVIFFNANGIFKLDLDKTPALWTKINSAIPTVLITNVDSSTTLIYGYKYNYGMVRLTGTDIPRDRTTAGVVPEQLSGPNAINSDYKDYGTTYQARPVGEEDTTYGVLTGGALGAAWDTAAEWSAVTDGQFAITLNGTAYNVECDFSSCTSMVGVAAVIQAALREFVSDMTCVFDTNHLVITSPSDGGSVTVTGAGAAGTNIGSAAMSCQVGTGTVTTPSYTGKNIIGTLTYPTDGGAWTHYSVCRSLDIGVKGIDPLTGKSNNKELLIWNRDHPVAKAFTASRVGTTVTATAGTFEEEDEGDTLDFADGTTAVIDTYTNSGSVETVAGGAVAAQAACVGGGSVAMASQTNTTVTRTAGDTFEAADVGKILFWANGDRTVITAYTNANVVEATPPQTGANIAAMGVTWDPVSRKMTDMVRDDYFGTSTTIKQLRTRVAGFSLENRFHVPLPDCDTGIVVGVFIISGIRGEQKGYYSQIPAYKTYLGGYYNEEKQVILFKDAIEHIIEFRDDACILCYHSTNSVPINTFNYEEIAEVGETVIVLAGQATVDAQIGLRDLGSLKRIGSDKYGMVNNDYGYRELGYVNGRLQYSENMALDRYYKDFQKFIDGFAASSYDAINGHNIWSKDIEDTTSFLILRETDDDGDAYVETDDDGDIYREVV